jgi:hypothetical protein
MALPMKLDGDRATVIEDVPPGTGIGDLIGAFSPIGPHLFCLCESSHRRELRNRSICRARADCVASMKSVSLLGAFREKKLQVPPAV